MPSSFTARAIFLISAQNEKSLPGGRLYILYITKRVNSIAVDSLLISVGVTRIKPAFD